MPYSTQYKPYLLPEPLADPVTALHHRLHIFCQGTYPSTGLKILNLFSNGNLDTFPAGLKDV